MAAILTDMADSQVPALSPIKSPKRPCDYDSPVNEIANAGPAPKKRKADEGSKSIRNRLTALETRRAKCKRSLQVWENTRKNSTRPYGWQFRPKPHIRFDREFQTALDQISHRAFTELLALMIKKQEKNLAADNQAIKLKPSSSYYRTCTENSTVSRLLETRLPTKPDQGLGLELRKHTMLNSLVISLPCRLNSLSYSKCFVN